MDRVKRSSRKIGVALLGFPVIIAGIAMLALPGPGLLTIAAGLAILSLEFEFAERWLKRVRKRLEDLPQKLRDQRSRRRR